MEEETGISLMELEKPLAALFEVGQEVEDCLRSSYDHEVEVLTALSTSPGADRFLRREKAKRGPAVQVSAGVYGQLRGTATRVAA